MSAHGPARPRRASRLRRRARHLAPGRRSATGRLRAVVAAQRVPRLPRNAVERRAGTDPRRRGDRVTGGAALEPGGGRAAPGPVDEPPGGRVGRGRGGFGASAAYEGPVPGDGTATLHRPASGDVLPTLAHWAARQGWIAQAGAVLLAHGCPAGASAAQIRHDHLAAGYGIGHAQAAATAAGVPSRPVGSWQGADLGAALGGPAGQDWVIHGLALGRTPAVDRTPRPTTGRRTGPATGRTNGPAVGSTTTTATGRGAGAATVPHAGAAADAGTGRSAGTATGRETPAAPRPATGPAPRPATGRKTPAAPRPAPRPAAGPAPGPATGREAGTATRPAPRPAIGRTNQGDEPS